MKNKYLLLLLIPVLAFALELDQSKPNMIITDENRVPLEGVSGSTSHETALEKIINLGPGKYKVIRPDWSVTVKDNGPLPADADLDKVPDTIDICPDTPPDTIVDDVGCADTGVPPVVDPPTPEPSAGLIQCPEVPTSVDNRRTWILCDINSADKPGYTANGSNYKFSYRIPAGASPTNKLQLYAFLHPSTPGEEFVTGSSSFDYASKDAAHQLELHTLEQTVGTNEAGEQNTGGWWGWSGHDKGNIDNYNGKILVAVIRYIVERHGDIIDLSHGLKMAGTSLGGAGVYIQAQLLVPLLDELKVDTGIDLQIASVASNWGIINVTEASESKVKIGWGTKAESPTYYAMTDIVANWQLVQNVHFNWGGGQNDGLGRMSTAFMDMCELRKVSCSLRWLQSGHAANETGYNLPHGTWLDPNQNATLDVILPVFTNNSSNHRGDLRGYFNRGNSWDQANIIDIESEIQVPLQYIAMTGIGPELPDQPDNMTFDVTLRHVKNFATPVGREFDWAFGDQSGTMAVGTDGLITIKDLKLKSLTGYTILSIKGIDDVVEPPVVVTPPPTGSRAYPVVYTRVLRTTGEYTVKLKDGTDYTDDNWDHMDMLQEVGRQYDNFNAPGQLVILYPDNTEKILYDCFKTPLPCVPLDPSVSLDGTKIAFTVFSAGNEGDYESGIKPPWPENRNYPPRLLSGVNGEGRIYVYDLTDDSLTSWPHVAGTHDSNPVWLPTGKMLFSSNREGFWAPFLNKIGTGKKPEPRLYLAEVDGTNAKDISPHEVTAALHPYLLANGRIAYSSQWLSHNLAYGTTNGSINWPGTKNNMWPIVDMDQEGGDSTAILGAHKTRMQGVNPRTNTVKALHFISQLTDGRITFTNYYRSNNLGLGDVIIARLTGYPLEGPAPDFNPVEMMSATTWSTAEDNTSKKDENGIYLGKTGWPEGVSNNQLMMTVGRGVCTQVASGIPGTNNMLKETGNIGCNTGIYTTTVLPSQHPDDLVKVVDSEDWHEYSAREVRARDVPALVTNKTEDGTCQLASSDAGSTDALHYGEYRFNKEYGFIDNNGSLIEAIDHDELAAIRFYQVIPNLAKKETEKNSIGNPVRFLGDAPLLADKSFKVQLPCDMPYLMVGVDKDGRAIKRDQIPQSLRPGEIRVCTGCHLHGEEGRPYEQSLAFNAEPLPIMLPKPVPTYTEDILPMLENRCASCHTPEDVLAGNGVPLFTYQGLVLDYFQTEVAEKNKIQVSTSENERKKYGLQRPLTSKYTNNMFARESLVYWKAANKRADGRTDDMYPDDIDFGADHPTDIIPSELKMLGDWLDSGATK